MDTLLGDLRSSFGTHHKEDFEYLKGRVLIIEPDDDKTFTDDIKEALINIIVTVFTNHETAFPQDVYLSDGEKVDKVMLYLEDNFR
jgi:hypothetical protein